ncbi:non-ribosomal peptide synthetase, partial [Paenibacillus caui]|uniref:non-ribosomal peptide synthetase n=1 Tax=Paenibacillus caui TaxID=2873927 RepID=UPI001CAA0891
MNNPGSENSWLDQQSGDNPYVLLPTDNPRPAQPSLRGEVMTFTLGSSQTESLRRLAFQSGTSLYATLLAVYSLFLSRYSRQLDVRVVCRIPSFEEFIPVHMYPAGAKVLGEYLGEVQDFLDCYDHPHPNPSTSQSSYINHKHLMSGEAAFSLLKKNHEQPEQYLCEPFYFDLWLFVTEEENQLLCTFIYSTDLFNPDTVRRMGEHFSQLVIAFGEGLHSTLSRLEMVPPAEKYCILEKFAGVSVDYSTGTIHHLFEEQVSRNPNNVAVIIDNQFLTYDQLNRKANRLARSLQAAGVQEGQTVVVMLEHSLELVIGLFAILKAGGAFVPISPDYPEERIRYLLEDSGAGVLLSQTRFRESALWFEGVRFDLDDDSVYASDDNNLELTQNSDHLAYIIYTSGTTGKPKGVMIEHRSIVNSLQWKAESYSLSSNDRVLVLNPYVFDGFVLNFFAPLISGATAILLNDEDRKDMVAIQRVIAGSKVTHMAGLHRYIMMILETMDPADFLSMKSVVVGGEKLDTDTVVKLLRMKPDLQINNEYGPTENSVVSTSLLIQNEKQPISIGRPIDNTHAYILGENDSLQPIGVIGELCLAGIGLARGYLNRPELTSDKFVPHPFVPGERIYRTGDLARWMPDGTIEYIGRTDHQVKIRGHRIELGEIETTLLNIGSVRQAVITAKGDGQGNQQLYAYFVSEKDLTASQLREKLLNELPDYMIPSYFIRVEHIPLTINGKVDFQSLALHDQHVINENLFEAPRSTLEWQLADIWAEVLSYPNIGIRDNFFEVGGDSLRATALLANIYKKLKVNIPLRELFRLPTIEQIAEHIKHEKTVDFLPIPTVEERSYYPLSTVQKRMYIVNQFDDEELSYNLPEAVILKGPLDIERLELSFRQLIKRHEILRTCFVIVDGEPVQRINPNVEFNLEIIDVERYQLSEKIDHFIRHFELDRAPLLRAGLLRLGLEEHILVTDMHHIVSDGKSAGILINELGWLYNGEDLPPLRIGYKDYTMWQLAEINSERSRQLEQYWLEIYRNGIPALNLPTDFPRPSKQIFAGDVVSFSIDKSMIAGLKKLSAQTGTTLYMTMFAIYTTLLYKYSDQEDLVVGSPVAGRSHADTDPLVGMFVNTLALRTFPSRDKSFQDYLIEVKDTILGALENQDYPFESLVEKLDIKRDLSRNPIFDTMFVLQNTEKGSLELEGLSIRPYPIRQNSAKFDLTLTATEEDGQIAGSFNYATALFKPDTIQRLKNHFLQLIQSVIENPQAPLGSLSLLSYEEQRQQLALYNQNTADFSLALTLDQWFADQASRTPEKTAVVWEDRRLTYSQLYRKVLQFASRIADATPDASPLVAVSTVSPLNFVIAALAAWQAGAAYLPIDPGTPKERVRFLLQDSGAACLVTDWAPEPEVVSITKWLNIQEADIELAFSVEATVPLYSERRFTASNPAYIIYTSGTTGTPKGVQVSHRNVVNYVHSLVKQAGIRTDDRTMLVSSYAFDLGYTALFTVLFSGGELHLATKELYADPEKLLQYIGQHGITYLKMTPSLFGMIVNSVYFTLHPIPSLRLLLLGGESIHPQDVRVLFKRYPAIRLMNHYGPTETTIGCITQPVDSSNLEVFLQRPVIGKPIHNTRAYILNAYNQLVPFGVIGELCISGEGVSLGYLNRPELTAEKFVPSPFDPNITLYRTGDLARQAADGTIEYMGRADKQVKIRGYRVELAEVEHALLQLPDIEQVVVQDLEHQGSAFLCAYIVADGVLSIPQVRGYLMELLPAYMVPTYYVQVNEIPITANGKIDRKALPSWKEGGIGTEEEYISPRNETEAKLADIWREVLGVSNIGVRDNFFEIGGHSLRAMTILSKLHKYFGINLALNDIFSFPTIEELALRIAGAAHEVYNFIPKAPECDYYPVSSSQKRMYIVNKLADEALSYNMPAIKIIEGPVDRGRVEEAFQKLIQRHASLRTDFHVINDCIVQRIHSDVAFSLEYGFTTDEELGAYARKFIREFNLAQAPLFRASLVGLASGRFALIVDIHHIISDGISGKILFNDFVRLYERQELPPLELEYKDYAVWQQSEVQQAQLAKKGAYWIETFTGDIPVLNLPTDFSRPLIQDYTGDEIKFSIGNEQTEALKKLVTESESTLFMVILAVYTILLARYSEQEDIIVGTPVTGRPQEELQQIIGMFVQTVVIRSHPKASKTFLDYAREVKEIALNAYANMDYPFEKLIDDLEITRDLSRNPLFDVMFVWNNLDDKNQECELILEDSPLGRFISKFDLTLTATEEDGQIAGSFNYATALFKPDTIQRLKNHFLQLIQSVIENPQAPLGSLSLLSYEEQRQQLALYNQNTADFSLALTLDQWFADQASRTPEKTAVVWEDRRLTYSQLYRKVLQFASRIADATPDASPLVAVSTVSPLNFVIAALAAWQAGAAYLPIDPGTPKERVRFLLQDSGAACLVTDWAPEPEVVSITKWLNIQEADIELAFSVEATVPLYSERRFTASNPAYIIYTSGTTGTPKGVQVSHRNVVNYVHSLVKQAGIRTDDRTMLVSSYAFDLGYTALFTVLFSGGELHLATKELYADPEKLLQYIGQHGITYLKMTPSLFGMIVNSVYFTLHPIPSLRLLLLGGESIHPQDVRVLFKRYPAIRLMNHYGPTETTIGCITQPVDSSNLEVFLQRPVIGKPIHNTRAYILNAYNQLVPFGVIGELCISGEGVSLGYLNRPELTAEKFVPSPFDPNITLYRTGDLARQAADGTIEYMGRADKQVKIRGYRVELAEVEHALLQLPDIEQVVV